MAFPPRHWTMRRGRERGRAGGDHAWAAADCDADGRSDQTRRRAFWKSPAKARSQFHDSSLAVDGSFVVPVEAELDEPTFCKMIALVQRPEYGFKRGHSAAQRDGWHAAFRNMDSDNAGTLSKGKVKRFLERRRRAFMETLKQKELQEMREAEGGTALADELQSRVDFHLKQQRARDAACAALDDVLAAGPTFGSLFPLTMALAPPLFACERATLWLARYEDDLPPPLPPVGDESFISRDGGSFVSRDGGSSPPPPVLPPLLRRWTWPPSKAAASTRAPR